MPQIESFDEVREFIKSTSEKTAIYGSNRLCVGTGAKAGGKTQSDRCLLCSGLYNRKVLKSPYTLKQKVYKLTELKGFNPYLRKTSYEPQPKVETKGFKFIAIHL